MLNDLTILYYTDNTLPSAFAHEVRAHLQASAQAAGCIPIVSVSQRPLEFARNICVGAIGRSYRSIIRQIHDGCYVARTQFVALCEHDVLYPPEHFALRPQDAPVVFDQNRHRALMNFGVFSLNRGGRSMQLVIAERRVLIRDFAAKLARCGTDADWHDCLEPGKGAEKLGIDPVQCEMAPATGPGILDICNHGGNYAPRKRRSGRLVDALAGWGTIAALARRFHIPIKNIRKGEGYGTH